LEEEEDRLLKIGPNKMCIFSRKIYKNKALDVDKREREVLI